MTTRKQYVAMFIILGFRIGVLGLSGQTVKYVPKPEELKYTFGGHPPVMKIKPGTTIVSWAEDCYDGKMKSPKDLPSKVIPLLHDNPCTGPFYVEGAEMGDVLAVHIVKIEPARPYAVSSYVPPFGAITGTDYTAILESPLPEVVWWYEVDKAKNTVRYKSLKGNHVFDLPMRPFLGCFGVAPGKNEVRWTVTPENYGGNNDCPEVRAGNTVYLPVSVPGAMLYFGDGHLVQGDGEIIGFAVESACNVELKVDLVKAKKINWPRIENDECLMTMGSYRPLEDAFRIATKDMVLWLAEDYGFDMMDSYQLVSQVMKAELAQLVDPNYTFLVKFPKKYLPKGKPAFGGMHDKLKSGR